MDERLRAIQREFIANPSEELAIEFMSLQCRLDPPHYSGKKISDLRVHMKKVYGRLATNLNLVGLTDEDPLERLIALDATELFSLYGFGFESRIQMLVGLVKEGILLPVSWTRYFERHAPFLSENLQAALDKINERN